LSEIFMLTRISQQASVLALVFGTMLGPPACISPSASESSESVQHAQCLVCKSEGDLACVDVKVHDDTPRTEYMGKTYYFCSEQCRKEFEKDPRRYLEQ
jgi:YHS domain-containing protein